MCVGLVFALCAAACTRGPLSSGEITPPRRATATQRPQRILVEGFTDARWRAPAEERWRDTGCLIAWRGTALRLAQPVTVTFRDLLVTALQARGHAIVDAAAKATVSIAGAVGDCALAGGGPPVIAVMEMTLRLRGAKGQKPIRRREVLDAPVKFRIPATRSNFLESLRDGLSMFEEHLATDEKLERAIQRAASDENG